MRFPIPSKTFHASLASGWMSICLFVLASGSPMAAETPTPDDHVSDEARVLKPETRSGLVAKIRQWESETGCTLWLATTTFLPGAKNVREHTDELAEAWMPKVVDSSWLMIAHPTPTPSHPLSKHGRLTLPQTWSRHFEQRVNPSVKKASRLKIDSSRPLKSSCSVFQKPTQNSGFTPNSSLALSRKRHFFSSSSFPPERFSFSHSWPGAKNDVQKMQCATFSRYSPQPRGSVRPTAEESSPSAADQSSSSSAFALDSDVVTSTPRSAKMASTRSTNLTGTRRR